MGLFSKKPTLSVVESPAPAARPDRARLKAAIAARDAAQREVIAAREALERLQSIVDEADSLSRAAADATRAAKEFRREWARNGCRYSETAELQALEDVAKEKAGAAERASVRADAVRKELSRAQDAVGQLQFTIREREDEIDAAIKEIIVSEWMPNLEDLEADAQRHRDKRAKVKCLERFLSMERYSERHAANQRIVDDALERATILSWEKEREPVQAADHLYRTRHDAEMIERHAAPLLERYAQLRQDPES
jgi:hypothetical protein